MRVTGSGAGRGAGAGRVMLSLQRSDGGKHNIVFTITLPWPAGSIAALEGFLVVVLVTVVIVMVVVVVVEKKYGVIRLIYSAVADNAIVVYVIFAGKQEMFTTGLPFLNEKHDTTRPGKHVFGQQIETSMY